MSVAARVDSPGPVRSRGRTPADLVGITAEFAREFGEDASLRDRERVFPREQVDALSATGVLAVTIPEAYGGAGGGAVEAAEISRLLATTDPSIAQIPHSHFVYLRLAELAGSEELKRQVFGEVVDGARIANAQSERGGASITDIRTTIRWNGGDAVVDGRKFYATGSLLADWLAVLARDEQGSDHIAFVRATDRGITIVDDWRGFGQRTTGSGTVTFEGVRVSDAFVAPRDEVLAGPHAYGPFAQVLHAAIDTGIARGALADAAAFVQNSARPWYEAEVARAAEDPLTIQRFGQLEVDVRAAEAALVIAAQAVDAAFSARTAALHAEASLAVAAAKVLADRAAIATSNAIFELSGASATDEALNLDRHWRNARTHTAHDPLRWKFQHLGRWTLEGIAPPRNGQI
jgi:SfnB family sulfur acquisition oxidoreductase